MPRQGRSSDHGETAAKISQCSTSGRIGQPKGEVKGCYVDQDASYGKNDACGEGDPK